MMILDDQIGFYLKHKELLISRMNWKIWWMQNRAMASIWIRVDGARNSNKCRMQNKTQPSKSMKKCINSMESRKHWNWSEIIWNHVTMICLKKDKLYLSTESLDYSQTYKIPSKCHRRNEKRWIFNWYRRISFLKYFRYKISHDIYATEKTQYVRGKTNEMCLFCFACSWNLTCIYLLILNT